MIQYIWLIDKPKTKIDNYRKRREKKVGDG